MLQDPGMAINTVMKKKYGKYFGFKRDATEYLIQSNIHNFRDNVRMYTYFIKPRTGTKEVDEEDLDEPTSLQIERELSKLVPGSRVFDTASRKAEPETEGAVRFILEYLFVCLFVFA